ncbi:MAG: carotenoid 1,2-hydratase, partial [Pseudomonadota bacterium]
ARGAADPMDFCALNVALYSQRQPRWVMTELRRELVDRQPQQLQLGASRLRVEDGRLSVDIDERSAPFRLPVRGRIVVTPGCITQRDFALTEGGAHRWWPISPSARVDVEFSAPGLAWSGPGYLDTNHGSEPLHEGFDRWHWSRTHGEGHTRLAYHAIERTGRLTDLALTVDSAGHFTKVPAFEAQRLPATPVWRAPRSANLAGSARVVRTLEDTPFYGRSIITSDSEPGRLTMHESLSLPRFRSAWVSTLIPFRMRFPWRRPG